MKKTLASPDDHSRATKRRKRDDTVESNQHSDRLQLLQNRSTGANSRAGLSSFIPHRGFAEMKTAERPAGLAASSVLDGTSSLLPARQGYHDPNLLTALDDLLRQRREMATATMLLEQARATRAFHHMDSSILRDNGLHSSRLAYPQDTLMNQGLPIRSQNTANLFDVSSMELAQLQLSQLSNPQPSLTAGLSFNPSTSSVLQASTQDQDFIQQELARRMEHRGRLLQSPPGDSRQPSAEAQRTQTKFIPLTLSSDEESLTEYQSLVRQQIYLFAASHMDIESNAQGRNRPINLGQVGIICRHCAFLAPAHRSRGAVYFPAKLAGLYQAAQNMAINHLIDSCRTIPEDVRAKLVKLKEQKASVLGGGKHYWANGARVLGVTELEHGLAFERGRN